jgi:hypothetical protein
MNVKLQGAELATYLAIHLTDLEFEMLIRDRIKLQFAAVHKHNENLSESYNNCTFNMSWGDEAKWNVGIGENYSKSADTSGQVLSRCVADVEAAFDRKSRNKLSLLLPAPKPLPAVEPEVPAEIEPVEPMKW